MWEAFLALDSSRQQTFGGAGSIPYDAIDRYAERNGIDEPDEFDELLRLLRVMDGVYAEHARKHKS